MSHFMLKFISDCNSWQLGLFIEPHNGTIFVSEGCITASKEMNSTSSKERTDNERLKECFNGICENFNKNNTQNTPLEEQVLLG